MLWEIDGFRLQVVDVIHADIPQERSKNNK